MKKKIIITFVLAFILGFLSSNLINNNIQSRRYFTPSLDLAYPEQKSFGCNNSQRIARGVICLPLHNFMTVDDITFITAIIRKVVK